MKKSINSIIIFLCVNFTLSTCDISSEKDKYAVPISDYIDLVEDTSLFVDANAFVLECNDNAMIASIDHVIEHDSLFYIFDKKRNQILFYNLNGKFINSIRAIGNGPGEYNMLMDIAIDRDAKQLLLLDYSYKILYYDLNGRYIKTEQLNNEISCHSLVVDKEFIYLLNPVYYNDKLSDYTITVIDKNNPQKTYHILKPLEETVPYCYPRGRTLNNGKNIMFVRLFDDNIYSLKGDECVPRILIDWGKFKLPDNIKGDLNCSDLLSYCWENKYVCMISNIIESNNSILFSTNLPGIFTLDSEADTIKYYRKVMNTDYNIIMPNYLPVDSEHGRVFFIYSISELQRMKNNIIKNPKLKEKYSKKIIELLDGISDDSNPLIFSYRLQ